MPTEEPEKRKGIDLPNATITVNIMSKEKLMRRLKNQNGTTLRNDSVVIKEMKKGRFHITEKALNHGQEEVKHELKKAFTLYESLHDLSDEEIQLNVIRRGSKSLEDHLENHINEFTDGLDSPNNDNLEEQPEVLRVDKNLEPNTGDRELVYEKKDSGYED